jgi:valyl-tRNA synthetase
VDGAAAPEALDGSVLASLARLIDEVTTAFEGYDYARALERTESFFWSFCDDYVELVKSRAYGTLGESRARSARLALRQTLSVLLRLFAPFLPYVTEEVWSWWHDGGSIHRVPWPAVGELGAVEGLPEVWAAASELLGEVRKAKTEAGVSLKAQVAVLRVRARQDRLDLGQAAADDLREAGAILTIEWAAATSEIAPVIEVVLA